uniref:Uncharacterized protein n=1 Tax=Romanomermis culicivorax TaxID=13658 RepID=A0A915JI69_ROMCU
MQSWAGVSPGGMPRKCSCVDTIIPTHNLTLQTNCHFHNSDINHKRIARFLHLDQYFDTTFNCLISTVYNQVCVTDIMIPEIIKNLRESQFPRVPANKLPFSSRATFYMWQEATKRYMCHINQEAAHSHCSYRKINHHIVLCIHPFPSRFRNHVTVNRANKPMPSVQNPKKTREEWEEEEYKQYSLVDDMQRRMETDPDLIREYEALGGYLSSDPSDAGPMMAQPSYKPHFTCNKPVQDPGGKIKAEIQQHLQCLKVDDKLVKRIIEDGPNPSARQQNETASGTLIIQAPHDIANKKMDYMYNCFNIVPIIFEETHAKR